MPSSLLITGGPAIELLDSPPQGTGHEVHFGIVVGSGQRVVVKFERTEGALEREQLALAWLGDQGLPAPKLVAAGPGRVGGRQVECLVTERCEGAPPTTIDGWQRMGYAYGQLMAASPTAPLPSIGPDAFGRQHAQRVRDLGDRLAPLANAIHDWEQLASEDIPGSPSMVITHGDPGPGNFLDHGDRGTIIDWEQAHIAPRGLDIARLFFIALLGSGPSGYIKRDLHTRARAVVAGYLDSTHDQWRPGENERRWWTAVAGIQFIHRRWQLRGHPAPWEEAAHVLENALATPIRWIDN